MGVGGRVGVVAISLLVTLLLPFIAFAGEVDITVIETSPTDIFWTGQQSAAGGGGWGYHIGPFLEVGNDIDIVVGAPFASDRGALTHVTVDATGAVTGQVVITDPQDDDFGLSSGALFGSDTAVMDLGSGVEVLIVGAPGDGKGSINKYGKGAVFVLVMDETTPNVVTSYTKLDLDLVLVPLPIDEDGFGESVAPACSFDTETTVALAVGAPGANGGVGSVHIINFDENTEMESAFEIDLTVALLGNSRIGGALACVTAPDGTEALAVGDSGAGMIMFVRPDQILSIDSSAVLDAINGGDEDLDLAGWPSSIEQVFNMGEVPEEESILLTGAPGSRNLIIIRISDFETVTAVDVLTVNPLLGLTLTKNYIEVGYNTDDAPSTDYFGSSGYYENPVFIVGDPVSVETDRSDIDLAEERIYMLESSLAIFCPADGDWDKTPAGETAVVECGEDYDGPKERACTEEGSWLIGTSCQRKCAADETWPETVEGSTATVSCVEGTSGTMTRKCSTGRVWEDPDTTNCILDECVLEGGDESLGAKRVRESGTLVFSRGASENAPEDGCSWNMIPSVAANDGDSERIQLRLNFLSISLDADPAAILEVWQVPYESGDETKIAQRNNIETNTIIELERGFYIQIDFQTAVQADLGFTFEYYAVPYIDTMDPLESLFSAEPEIDIVGSFMPITTSMCRFFPNPEEGTDYVNEVNAVGGDSATALTCRMNALSDLPSSTETYWIQVSNDLGEHWWPEEPTTDTATDIQYTFSSEICDANNNITDNYAIIRDKKAPYRYFQDLVCSWHVEPEDVDPTTGIQVYALLKFDAVSSDQLSVTVEWVDDQLGEQSITWSSNSLFELGSTCDVGDLDGELVCYLEVFASSFDITYSAQGVEGETHPGNGRFVVIETFVRPVLTSISPSSGPFNQVTTVTVTGKHFITPILDGTDEVGGEFTKCAIGTAIQSSATVVNSTYLTCNIETHPRAVEDLSVVATTSGASMDYLRNRIVAFRSADVAEFTFEACDPGSVAASHEVSCSSCPRGKWSDGIMTECESCVAGTFVARQGSSVCSNCLSGTYSFLDGQTACRDCPNGHFQPEFGATSCISCLSVVCDSKNLPFNDTSCATNQEVVVAEDTCSHCELELYVTLTYPAGATAAAECACSAKAYDLSLSDGSNSLRCATCPDNADCTDSPVGGIPIPITGFYALKEGDPASFQRCSSDGCPGLADTACSPGYKGRLCGSCDEGYFKVENRCFECDTSEGVLIFVAIVVFLTICAFLSWMAWTRMKYVDHERMEEYTMRDKAWSHDHKYILKRAMSRTMASGALWLILNFLQVTVIIGNFAVDWPDFVTSFFEVISFTILNIELIRPECIVSDVSFANKWTFVMLYPLFGAIAFGLNFFIVFLYLKWRHDFVFKKVDEKWGIIHRDFKDTPDMHVSLHKLWLFILYAKSRRRSTVKTSAARRRSLGVKHGINNAADLDRALADEGGDEFVVETSAPYESNKELNLSSSSLRKEKKKMSLSVSFGDKPRKMERVEEEVVQNEKTEENDEALKTDDVIVSSNQADSDSGADMSEGDAVVVTLNKDGSVKSVNDTPPKKEPSGIRKLFSFKKSSKSDIPQYDGQNEDDAEQDDHDDDMDSSEDSESETEGEDDVGAEVAEELSKGGDNFNLFVVRLHNLGLALQNASLMFIVIVYPILARSAFEVFACVDLKASDVKVLRADPELICDVFEDGEYAVLFGIGFICVMLYPIGIPLGLAVLLKINEPTIELKSKQLRFGFLVERYRPAFYWWEIVGLVRKLAFIICELFFPDIPDFQLMVAQIVLFGTLLLQTSSSPFILPAHSIMDFLLLIDDYIVVFGGLVILAGHEDWRDSLGYLVIFTIVVVAFFSLLYVVWRWYLTSEWARNSFKQDDDEESAQSIAVFQQMTKKDRKLILKFLDENFSDDRQAVILLWIIENKKRMKNDPEAWQTFLGEMRDFMSFSVGERFKIDIDDKYIPISRPEFVMGNYIVHVFRNQVAVQRAARKFAEKVCSLVDHEILRNVVDYVDRRYRARGNLDVAVDALGHERLVAMDDLSRQKKGAAQDRRAFAFSWILNEWQKNPATYLQPFKNPGAALSKEDQKALRKQAVWKSDHSYEGGVLRCIREELHGQYFEKSKRYHSKSETKKKKASNFLMSMGKMLKTIAKGRAKDCIVPDVDEEVMQWYKEGDDEVTRTDVTWTDSETDPSLSF